MHADRHSTLVQQAHRLGQPGCAFDLEHMGAGLHQLGRAAQGLFSGGVGHEWQVGQDQCPVVAALDRRDVIGHVSGADGQGAVVSLQHHAQGVAYQQDFDACLAAGVGKGGVVAGQHGDFLTFLLEALQGGQSDVWHERGPHFRRFGNYCE